MLTQLLFIIYIFHFLFHCRHGSIEEYMVSIGFSLAEQKALKENLIAFENNHVKDICRKAQLNLTDMDENNANKDFIDEKQNFI